MNFCGKPSTCWSIERGSGSGVDCNGAGALICDVALAATGVAGFGAGLWIAGGFETRRAGIWTIGLRPVICAPLFSPLISGFASAFTADFSTSSCTGEHILQVQFCMSLVSSVHSHSKCGKNSTGLLKRFRGPLG